MADLEAERQRVIDALRANTTPIFFLSRYGAHLRGVDGWIPAMTSIFIRPSSGADSMPARHFTPSDLPSLSEAAEEPVNWLLRHPEVQEFIARSTPEGVRPHIVCSTHDATTEHLCDALGYRLMSVPLATRHRLDSKLFLAEVAVRERLGPVPHTVTRVSTYDDLVRVSRDHGLGEHVVIQTAYGEGGDGTWFVRSRADFEQHRAAFADRDVRIMRYVRHQPLAIEAVATRNGVIVGPLERDIIGHAEVAVFEGSSSGLEYAPTLLDDARRREIVQRVERLGRILIDEGYRGLFEVDFLLDDDTGEVFFGEMNPRFSGCGMVSNAVTAHAWGLPLYALHLLEFLDIDVQLTPRVWNETWSAMPAGNEWSNILIRHLDARPSVDAVVPATGTYRVTDDARLEFVEPGSHWFDLASPGHVFYLAYHSPGTIRVRNDTIGVLIGRGLAQDERAQFTEESRSLITAVHDLYETRPLTTIERAWRSFRRRLSARFGSPRRRPRG